MSRPAAEEDAKLIPVALRPRLGGESPSAPPPQAPPPAAFVITWQPAGAGSVPVNAEATPKPPAAEKAPPPPPVSRWQPRYVANDSPYAHAVEGGGTTGLPLGRIEPLASRWMPVATPPASPYAFVPVSREP